jgi:sialic acid synthase
MYKNPITIAEIGCNHKGEFEIAKRLIDLAKSCGASYAKFQKRNSKELLTKEQYEASHPNPHNSYGDTYGAHREFLEFTKEQHQGLKSYSESIEVGYATSVWDVTSAIEIISLNPDFIKIPSACNNHYDMLETLRDTYTGEIHASLGMTTKKEEQQLIEFFEKNNSAKDRLVLYSCTSGYPVPFSNVCLLEIKRIKETYGHRIKDVGFSGHHLGIAIDIAAYTLGGNYIERHFTQDRTWKGTDHAASLEPSGFGKMVRNLNATNLSLTYKDSEILEIESVQREKLKYRKH